MKKIALLVIIIMSLTMLGCSNNEAREWTIDDIVADLYNHDFDYTKVDSSYNSIIGKNTVSTWLGKYTQDPYEEHLTFDYENSEIIESSSTDTVEVTTLGTDEIIYSMDNGVVVFDIHTDDGWSRHQAFQRPYFYGYGEEITFQNIGKTDIESIGMSNYIGDYNGVEVDHYSGEYTVDIAKKYGYGEEIIAVIVQQYYVSASDNKILKIVTDLDDYYEKINLANYMSSSEESYSEALENYQGESYPGSQEVIFYNYR